MKAKEYIESGMLELHATGALCGREQTEAEQMIQEYPEVATEYEAIQVTLEKFNTAQSVTPPAHVRDRVLNEIKSLGEKKVIPITRNNNSNSNFYQYAVAASVALLLLSSFAAFYFAGKFNSTKTELAGLKNQYDTLNNNMSVVLANQEQMKEAMDMINGMNTMKVKLSGTEKHPGMQVLVYYDMDSKHIMLDPGNLPQLPDSLQYQLWALKGTTVLDAGAFSPIAGMLNLKPAADAELFAITIEKYGGSPTPHVDQMVAMGKISI